MNMPGFTAEASLIKAKGVYRGTQARAASQGTVEPANWGSCREGAMFCDDVSGGFYTCAQGRYVYRDCGPGTRCQQQGQDNIFCNYA